MIFTGYTLFAYFLQNSKDYLPESPYLKRFIKEEPITSKNYIYILGVLDEGRFKPGLFIKQSKNFDSRNLLALNTENDAYDNITKVQALQGLFLEKLDFIKDINLLVLKYTEGESADTGFLIYTCDVAQNLAKSLSTTLALFHLHLTQVINKNNPNFLLFKPEIFSLTKEYIDNVDKIRAMNLKIKVSSKIPSTNVINLLAKIHPYLSEIDFKQDTLIHNDIRYPNFFKDSGASTYKLLDWELACWGDKYWDLAALFDMFLQKSLTPNWLNYTQKAIVEVWNNYHSIMNIIPTDDDLIRLIQFVGLNRIANQLAQENDDLDPELVDLITTPQTAEYRHTNIWKTIKTNS